MVRFFIIVQKILMYLRGFPAVWMSSGLNESSEFHFKSLDSRFNSEINANSCFQERVTSFLIL